MPVRASARRRRALSMTSLIDVIFLLLLFFMLSSTFTRFAEIRLDTGAGGRVGSAAAEGPPLFLRLTGASISLNGSDVALEALAERLRELTAPPEGTESMPTSLIVDPVGEEVTSQQLVDLLIVVRAPPELRVRVLE